MVRTNAAATAIVILPKFLLFRVLVCFMTPFFRTYKRASVLPATTRENRDESPLSSRSRGVCQRTL